MISIALATYNGEKYLRQQIESLYRQTIPFNKLVICDDCSCDNTVSIIEEYASKDNRILFIRNDVNIGFRNNFQKAVGLCDGDYILLCDQDDIWLPNHIETLLDNIKGNCLICGGSELMSENGFHNGTMLSCVLNYRKNIFVPNDSIAKFILFYQNPFQGAAMMITSEFARKAFPIPEDIHYHDVWLATLACLYNSFCFVDNPVILYRQHEYNASGVKSNKSKVRTFLGHVLKKKLSNGRYEIIDSIKRNFVSDLPKSSLQLIHLAYEYHIRSRSIFGKLRNILFELLNWRTIYGTK